ncbi:Cellulose synthase regulatory subunit [Serratia liquefaciens]|nr:Cellulose synthase regulatory subunit [Serratia liquefaciens]
MTRKITWFTALALGISTLSQAETATAPTVAAQPPVNVPADASVTTPMGSAAPVDPNAPVRDVQLPFATIAPPPGTFTLRGT